MKYLLTRLTTCLCLFTAIPSFANIIGNDRVIICSSGLGVDFTSCPSNLASKAVSVVPIHAEFYPCDNPPMCDAVDVEFEHRPKIDVVTVFDVDNQRTEKFEITVYPNVYDNRHNIVINGRKLAKSLSTSTAEKQVTQAFYESSLARKAVIDAYSLAISNSGMITDATGSTSSSIPRSSLTCTTAWDYISHNTCEGDLNRDIDDGIASNATFYAMISSLEKLETVMGIVVPRVDLSNIEKLTSFPVKIVMSDGSILVINVVVDQGVANITLNEKGSRTSSGHTFESIIKYGTKQITSLAEAEAFARGGVTIGCIPKTGSYTSLDVVKVIISYRPDGTKVYTHVYGENRNYVIFNKC
ncbi:MAG: hypothetical protein VX100_11250 [Pseudomonadota bacterium]|nr:hypothetical protein [Pseudomonadota bacterium]